MSRVAEETKASKSRKPKTNGNKTYVKRFISFHPTKEEKEYIRAMEESLEDCLVGLRPWLEDGHKLTIGWSGKNDACFASIRESTDNWRDARAVSAWHADPDVALRSLCYAITSRFPAFPEIEFGQADYELDW